MVTYNHAELIEESNRFFVQGTRKGSRRAIALQLSQIFNFPGGYRAAYREVKKGYTSCGVYAGKLSNGEYGINAMEQ